MTVPVPASTTVPAVSVIVRSMDRPTLTAAMASVHAQTFRDVELVVVNARGAGHRPLEEGERLRLVGAADSGGLPRARAANVGLEAARGRRLLFLDDDDLLLPEHLARLVEALERHPQAVAAYADVELGSTGEQGDWQVQRRFADDFDPVRLAYENFLPIHAVLFDRRCIDQGLRFDEQLQLLEDWDFWQGCAALGSFVRVPGVSARYRADTGGNSAVFESSALADASLARVLTKWHARLPDAHFVEIVRRLLQAQRLEQHARRRLEASLLERDSLQQVLAAREVEIANLHRHVAGLDGRLQARDAEIVSLRAALAAAARESVAQAARHTPLGGRLRAWLGRARRPG